MVNTPYLYFVNPRKAILNCATVEINLNVYGPIYHNIIMKNVLGLFVMIFKEISLFFQEDTVYRSLNNDSVLFWYKTRTTFH